MLPKPRLFLSIVVVCWPTSFVFSATPTVTLPSTIRVCISHQRGPVVIRCSGDFEYFAGGAQHTVGKESSLTVIPSGRNIKIDRQTFSGEVTMTPVNPTDVIAVNRRRYRGTIIFESSGRSRMNVIERVDLEQYVYGVLAREMGSEWPAEALKAQAIVSRTYVLANLSTDQSRGYDVASDVSDQVYGGVEDESKSVISAVEATRGEIIVDKSGKPIDAFFHSSCGGETETPDYVWRYNNTDGGFASVKDPYCKEDPYYHWTVTLSVKTIQNRLKHHGLRVGDISKIKISQKSPSGRAAEFLIVSSRAKTTVSGNRFRLAIGPETLRSTLITDISRDKRSFTFKGRGWGHGVGLCQWGARGRALAGQNAEAIVAAYYPTARLTTMTAR